jgi:hypothetical protein
VPAAQWSSLRTEHHLAQARIAGDGINAMAMETGAPSRRRVPNARLAELFWNDRSETHPQVSA